MKKFKLLLISLVISLTLPMLSSCFFRYDLSFFNWGEYIDQEVVKAFEKKYNVRVKQRFYDSNELLMAKLDSQSYDVLVPSDYTIEELATKEMIQPIDWSLLNFTPNDLPDGLHEALNNLKEDKIGIKGFDLLNYSVPYTWGEIGLVYRTDKISKEEIEEKGWETLRTKTNQDGTPRKVAMYNAARDVYSMALIANHLPITSPTDDELMIATSWLKEQKKILGNNLFYKTEELLDDIPNLTYDITFTYVGDAIYGISETENPDNLAFYIPPHTGGPSRTNIYTDGLVIHKDCKNVLLAHQFIDFLMEYENAYKNTVEIGYTTTNKEVYNDIVGEGEEFETVKDAYCFETSSYDTFYRYDPQLKEKLEDEWIKVTVN